MRLRLNSLVALCLFFPTIVNATPLLVTKLDGTVVGLQDIYVNGIIYDIDFFAETPGEVYGPFPVFDTSEPPSWNPPESDWPEIYDFVSFESTRPFAEALMDQFLVPYIEAGRSVTDLLGCENCRPDEFWRVAVPWSFYLADETEMLYFFAEVGNNTEPGGPTYNIGDFAAPADSLGALGVSTIWRKAEVPEPGTLGLMTAGLLGFAMMRRKRQA